MAQRLNPDLRAAAHAPSMPEQRSDLLLSTLRTTAEAMDGNLSLIAKFPDRPPVELAGIAENDPGD